MPCWKVTQAKDKCVVYRRFLLFWWLEIAQFSAPAAAYEFIEHRVPVVGRFRLHWETAS